MMNVINFMTSAMMIMANGAVTPNATMVNELNEVYETMVDEMKENYWAAKAKREAEAQVKIEYHRETEEGTNVYIAIFADGSTTMGDAETMSVSVSRKTDYYCVMVDDEGYILMNGTGDCITVEWDCHGENEYTYEAKKGYIL